MKLKHPLPLFSGNILKLIAILTMTFDHFSAIFYPGVSWMRIPGRIAFPIFAFLLAEGFRYTRNRLRYLLVMGAFASVSHMAVLWISDGSWTSILATFTASLALCWLLEFAKKCIFDPTSKLYLRILIPVAFVLAVLVLYYDTRLGELFDYGFWGVMLPVFASFFHPVRGMQCPSWWERIDILPVHLLAFGIALVALNSQFRGTTQPYAILALIPLLFYSGKRGQFSLKYSFYIYYPTHILILQGIKLLIDGISK